jgi:O-antigen ligase
VWTSLPGFVLLLGASLLVRNQVNPLPAFAPKLSTIAVVFVALITLSQMANTSSEADLTSTGLVLCSYFLLATIIRRFSLSEILLFSALAISVVSIASLLMILFNPNQAFTYTPFGDAYLKGLYPHRNLLGLTSGLAIVILFGAVRRTTSTIRFALVSLIGVNMFTLLWARSITSVTALALVIICSISIRQLNERKMSSKLRSYLFLLLATVSAVSIAWILSDGFAITGLVSRDDTLTGRTQIWQIWFEQIDEVGFLGNGWSQAWTENDRFSVLVMNDFGFPIAHAHNLLLDVHTRAGILASALTFVLIVRGLAVTLRSTVKARSEPNLLLPVQIYLVVCGTSESLLYLPIFFFVFLLAFGFRAEALNQSANPYRRSPASPRPGTM